MAGKEKSWYIKRCGVSVLAGLAALALCCMLFAFLTLRGIIPEQWIVKCVSLCVFLSSACACTMSSRGTVKRTAMTAATAAAFLLALVLLGLAGFDKISGERILWHAGSIALGAALSFMRKQKGRAGKRTSSSEHKVKRRPRR